MVSDKEVFEFPCYFALRAIGKDVQDYKQFVIATVGLFIENLDANSVTTRPSHGDKYLAVIVPFTAQSREQLDSIYEKLGQDSRTVFLL
jgi:putative lipoic acid-binding regulatory protein